MTPTEKQEALLWSLGGSANLVTGAKNATERKELFDRLVERKIEALRAHAEEEWSNTRKRNP